MAKKKKRRGGKSITRTAFKWVRIGALAAPLVRRAIQGQGDLGGTVNNILSDYTGYNMTEGVWRLDYLANGWLPYIAASLATYGIPKIASIIRRL